MEIALYAAIGLLAVILMTETAWSHLYQAWDSLIERVWRS